MTSSSHDRRIDEIIAEYLDAVASGQQPDPQEIMARYLDLADCLREFFADDQAARKLFEAAEEPRNSAASTIGPAAPSSPNCLPPAGHFGDYELLEKLGEGGMGLVFKAHHRRLKRTVALKLIAAGKHARADELRRFQIEAEAVARLQHPGIVQIFEVGEHEGQMFLALELCEGGTLAQRLEGKQLPPEEAARITQQLAEAVEAAHRQRIVHRDLKPGNVMLTADGQLKITDFGLAKKLDELERLTESNAIVGTPQYMAPEQAAGQTRLVGPAVDTWALGVMLYEMLTGRPPFKGATPLETLQQVISSEPVPPRQWNRQVPVDLETICLKCLEKDTLRRYAGTQDVVQELTRFLAGEPIRARHVGRVQRAWRWCRRQPVVAGLMASVVLVLLAGTAISTFFALQADAGAREVGKQKENVEHALTLANLQTRSAVDARNAAQKSQKELRQQLYYHLVSLAEREWLANNVQRSLELLEQCPPELRRWEWYYLRRLHETGFTILHGHQGSVRALAYTRDGAYLASGGQDGIVVIWDASSREKKTSLIAGDPVLALAFHPESAVLAGISADGMVKLWNWREQKLLREWKAHVNTSPDITWSPDGKTLATAGATDQPNSGTGEVRLWDPETGEARERFAVGGVWWRHGVRFGPNGKQLLTTADVAPQSGSPVLWDLQSRRRSKPAVGHRWGLSGVDFSPLGNRIVSADVSGRAIVWDIASGNRVVTLHGHENRIQAIAYSRRGDRIAAAGEDQCVLVWDASTGEVVHTLRGHTGSINAVAFGAEDRFIASASDDGTVRIWDAVRGQQPLSSQYQTANAFRVDDIQFSPEGGSVAFGCRDPKWVPYVGIMDVETAERQAGPKGHEMAVRRVLYAPGGKDLITASDDRTVRVWDRNTHKLLHKFQHDEAVCGLAMTMDGSRLVTASGHTVHVWQLSDKKLLQKFLVPGRVKALAITPEGGRLCIAGEDRLVRIWNLQTGTAIRTLRGHSDQVLDVCVDPAGRWLASASADRTVRVWQLDDGKLIQQFKGHTREVTRAFFSPDSERLFTAGNDGTIRVWETNSGRRVLTLPGHDQGVGALAMSPDGTHLASASKVGFVKFWDATPLDTNYASRVAARWVLSVGGKLRLGDKEATDASSLPSDLSAVTGIQFSASSRVIDSDLVKLEQFAGLRSLDLTGLDITPAAVTHLTGFKHLRILRLSGTHLSHVDVQKLRGLLPGCELEWEAYEQDRQAAEWVCGVGGKVTILQGGTKSLLQKPVGRTEAPFRLIEIDLSAYPNTRDEDLIQIANLKSLESLRLFGVAITDAGMQHLSALTTLNRLSLENTSVSGPGWAYLKDLRQLSWIRCHPITDEALVSIPQLGNLSQLWLGAKLLSDEGLRHISRHPGLTKLGLSGGRFSRDGLSNLLALPNLRHLELNGIRLTDDCLVTVGKISSLETLILNGCTSVDDAGMEHLQALKNLKQLQVKKTYVTKAGIAALQARLPNCTSYCETVQRPEERLAQLTKAIQADPADFHSRIQRAQQHSLLRRWRECADDYEEALKLKPKHLWQLNEAARVQLLLGNEEAYLRHCRSVVQYFKENSIPTDSLMWQTARVHALLPGDSRDYALLLRGATQCASELPHVWYSAACPAPLLYRLGRYEEALTVLKSTGGLAAYGAPQCAHQLWMALTSYQLGHREEARQQLGTAIRFMETELPGPGEPLSSFPEFMECQILRREAERLILKAESQLKQDQQ